MNECEYMTHAKSILIKHERIKHDTNPCMFFSCDECDFKTKYKFHLKDHKRKHAKIGLRNTTELTLNSSS